MFDLINRTLFSPFIYTQHQAFKSQQNFDLSFFGSSTKQKENGKESSDARWLARIIKEDNLIYRKENKILYFCLFLTTTTTIAG
jgi:hypothetical protein